MGAGGDLQEGAGGGCREAGEECPGGAEGGSTAEARRITAAHLSGRPRRQVSSAAVLRSTHLGTILYNTCF